MAVRDYFLLSRSDREVLAQRLRTALDRWEEAWCAGESTPTDVAFCRVDEIDGVVDLEWEKGYLGDTQAAAAVAFIDSADTLVAALIGVPDGTAGGTGAIAEDLKRAARRDLIGLLLGGESRSPSVSYAPDRPAPAWKDSTHGFAVARCRCRGVNFLAALYPGLTSEYLRPRKSSGKARSPEIKPVRAALHSERVVLDVCVGEAELMLPEVATLAVGDVICLDRRLEQPALIRLGGGAVCAGHIGLQGGRKAVQLTFLDDKTEV